MHDQMTWAERNPRLSGAFVILMGALLAAMNFAQLAIDGTGWSKLFPLAGICVSAGVLQTIAGVNPREFRAAPVWYRVALVVAAVVGMAAGLGLNWIVFGTV